MFPRSRFRRVHAGLAYGLLADWAGPPSQCTMHLYPKPRPVHGEHTAFPVVYAGVPMLGDASVSLYQRARVVDEVELAALLDAGADPDFAPEEASNSTFLRIVRRFDGRLIDALLRAGADPASADRGDGRTAFDRGDGRTALHVLAMEPSHDVAPLAERLIEAGARVDARDADGWTPLDCAALFARSELVAVLVAHGACAESHGLLDAAVRRPRVLQVLLQAGAPVVAGERDTRSALHAAVVQQQLESLRCLIEAGSPVNARTQDRGVTPLHMAVASQDEELVQALLQAGADPTIPDNGGRSPLDDAVRQADVALVELLAGAAGSDPWGQDALTAVRERLRALALREDALVARMAEGTCRFHMVTPGFKYEYDDQQRVWCSDGVWFSETHDGYSDRTTTRKVARDAALAHMRELCTFRGESPERRMQRMEDAVSS